MKWNDDSFVDLYDLLDVWPDVESKALRHRIAELYLEARENLEHQNHRKRFYYRELYELQLPQARSILLDPECRKEYDQQLRQYWQRKGKPPSPTKPKDTARPKLDGLPGAISEDKAADDFSDFADIAEESLPPLQIAQPLLDAVTLEQRRNAKRHELIKHELVATGTRWALLGGSGAFLLGAALAALINLALTPPPPAVIFYLIAIIFLLGASALTARQTMRWAKRRTVGVLSQMPYDELLRRCGAA